MSGEQLPGFSVVIPARFTSTRLPGKPLRLLAGTPLIEHVARRALTMGRDEMAADEGRPAAGALEGEQLCAEPLASVAVRRAAPREHERLDSLGSCSPDDLELPAEVPTRVADDDRPSGFAGGFESAAGHFGEVRIRDVVDDESDRGVARAGERTRMGVGGVGEGGGRREDA
ncbi:Acylneuraminate cytidylyltransferase [mine drainage metagenome]|uniref:Acylneuraminate cytidylyltransferase n=1 Tax=mine drainage metagenome TaxID=410659 RepID=T0YI87_9ZZZZ